MKTIYFLRHAKSSWENLNIKDHDRPLNDRGKKDAKRIGSYLKKNENEIDIIITSSALRAKITASLCDEKLSVSNVISEPKLYLSTPREMMEVIQNIHTEVKSAIIVAHNPGLTEMANFFSETDIYNVPTAGCFKVLFDTDNWQEVSFSNGKLDFIIFPKILNND